MAERVGQKPEQVRKQFERNEQVPLVRSDIRKRKALEWLLEQVEMVDETGQPVDREPALDDRGRAATTMATTDDHAEPTTDDPDHEDEDE